MTNKGCISSLINRTEKKGEGWYRCILERNIKLSLCECLGLVNEYRKGPEASVKSSKSSNGHCWAAGGFPRLETLYMHAHRDGQSSKCPTGWLCLGKGTHLRG